MQPALHPPFPSGVVLIFERNRVSMGQEPIYLGNSWLSIKLIAIDMDGTLLLPDHTISPAVKNAIAAARARGVNVVLTTGRPYAGVHNYLKELHMEQPGDYCITYNGALVQKAADGSTVAQTALSYDDYRFLEKLSREVGSHFHALDRTTLYPRTGPHHAVHRQP